MKNYNKKKIKNNKEILLKKCKETSNYMNNNKEKACKKIRKIRRALNKLKIKGRNVKRTLIFKR